MKRNFIYTLFILLLGCCMINPVDAQKPKGSYKGNKQAIQQAYQDEMRDIASRKHLPSRQRKLQRDAAMDRYLADKRANRQAFRKSTDHNRDAIDKRNRGYVPKLRKN
jgi:hypothetical protein